MSQSRSSRPLSSAPRFTVSRAATTREERTPQLNVPVPQLAPYRRRLTYYRTDRLYPDGPDDVFLCRSSCQSEPGRVTN